MNANELLRHYERVADAPGAIGRLRQLVLDLAVRGKLVQPTSDDSTASALSARLEAEKSRMIKTGLIRSTAKALPIAQNEMPISVPQHWAWRRLCDIGRLAGGMTPSMSRSEYWGGDVVWLSPKDIKADEVSDSELKITNLGLSETRLEAFPARSLFIVARSGILKRKLPVAINRVAAAANQDMKVLVPFVAGLERYLQIMFLGMSDYILRELVKTGTTVQSLKYAEFEVQPCPIPPLEEQHRIVAKVDELMALCDRLEAARAEREAARDRLTAASLARLNTPDPETFSEDAGFALNAFRNLTTRRDQIKDVRQTILNLAATGKLVLQDETEEPAAVLLARLSSQRAGLVDSGVIPTRPKAAHRDHKRYADGLPTGWVPSALGDLCILITSGSRGWAEYYAETGPAFVRAQNIRFGRLLLDELARVNPPNKSEGSRTQVAKSDLLVVITGAGVTNPGLLDRDIGEAYVSQHVALVRPTDTELSPWLLLCLMAPAGGRAELVECAYGSGKPGLNLDNLRSLSIPIPPVAEQKRILAKLGELLSVCDQLETAQGKADEHRSRLLEALIRKAVKPMNAFEMAA